MLLFLVLGLAPDRAAAYDACLSSADFDACIVRHEQQHRAKDCEIVAERALAAAKATLACHCKDHLADFHRYQALERAVCGVP